jgi:hypothetical protein
MANSLQVGSLRLGESVLVGFEVKVLKCGAGEGCNRSVGLIM